MDGTGSAGGETALSRYERELVAQGYRPSTVLVKVAAVRLAATHADVEPVDLTRDDVLAWLGDGERADWTRLKYLSHLSAWFRWLGGEDHTAGIRRPRQPAGLPRPVSEDDLARILAAAQGRTRAWVLLGAYCGLRSHESAKVEAGDLELSVGGSWALRVLGKGQQWAMVPAPPVVVDELRPWVIDVRRGRLWPEATSTTVQRAIRRLARSVGVECSSHQLRHRYGTAVYSTERDLLLTQQLMRHRSPQTTAGYAAVSGDRRSAVVAALPGAQPVEPGRPALRLVR